MSRSREIQSLVVMCRRLDRPHGGAALRNLQNVRGLAKLGPVDVISVGPSEAPGTGGRRETLRAHRQRRTKIPAFIASGASGGCSIPSAHPMVSEIYQESVVAAIRRRFRKIFLRCGGGRGTRSCPVSGGFEKRLLPYDFRRPQPGEFTERRHGGDRRPAIPDSSEDGNAV